MRVVSNSEEKLFKSRAEAAIKLIEILPIASIEKDDSIIIAISRGAVPIANILATRSSCYYDLLFTKHITAPKNSECEIAIVSETEEIVIFKNLVDSFNITYDFIYGEAHRKYETEILKYQYKYRKGERISSLKSKNVILLDEGCESGLTAMVSIKTAINLGAKSVNYVSPVIPYSIVKDLQSVADEVYSVYEIVDFVNTPHYYQNLVQLKSEEILNIIDNSQMYLPFNKKERD